MASRTKKSGTDTDRGSNVRRLAPLADSFDPATDLLEQYEPQRNIGDIVLSDGVSETIASIMQEYRNAEMLRRHHLPVSSRMLLTGPPGCGKTLLAEVVASELGLPLYFVRLDAVISSYLGETASNLRHIFEYAKRVPCVLFLDEFDALGRTRTDTSEHNELRRVVNSLLTMMERQRSRGLFIAATNLPDSLDHAVWRRFDEIIEMSVPNKANINSLLALKFKNFKTSFKLENKVKELGDMSYADIERICFNTIKLAVMARKKTASVKDFTSALKRERRRLAIRG